MAVNNKAKMVLDGNDKHYPAFPFREAVTTTADIPFTHENFFGVEADLVMIPAASVITLNGVAVPFPAYTVLALVPGRTYTINVAVNVAVA